MVAISAFGEQSLALTASGAVVSWGNNSAGQRNIPAGLTNVTAIAAGDYFDLALTTAGKVVAWGSNTYGQTNVPAGLSNVVAIAAGSSLGNAQSWGLALTSGGQVVGWGGNNFGQISIPSGLSNVVAIATGWYDSMALKADGTVVAWGASGANYGQLTPPAGLSNVVAIVGGNVHSLALVETKQSGAIVITSQPTNQTVQVGGTATFAVADSGTTPLQYQWSFNSNNIAGGTNTTLIIPSLALTNSGYYSVVISNSYGAVTSSIAALTVLLPATITSQPQSVTATAGDTVGFSVTATANGPLSYQWVGPGSALIGSTNTTLTLTNVQPVNMGSYYVVVTSQFGSVTSSIANLTVLLPAPVPAQVSFTNSSTPGVGTQPIWVTAADLNGDGKLELICANSGGNTLSILTNNGSGGFVLASTTIVGNYAVAVVAADVNGDGKLDLVSANDNDNTLSILTNNGSGGFVLASTPGVGNNPYSVIAADLNGDGKVDLVCANYGRGGGNTLSVFTNNGSGGFTLASSPCVGS